MIVRFLRPARDDLHFAISYYESRRPGLGRAFLKEVAAAVTRVRDFPEAWQMMDDEVRRCQLRRFPYGLMFVVRDDQILILAVANLHREPDHWRDRLR